MKKELIAIITISSILLTGCEGNNNKTIDVPYTDMFKTSTSSIPENSNFLSELSFANDSLAVTDSSLDSKGETKKISSETALQSNIFSSPFTKEENLPQNNTVPLTQEEYYDYFSDKSMLAAGEDINNSPEQSTTGDNQKTEPPMQANESNPQNNPLARIGVPTDNQEIANAPIDEVCYLPYKVTDPEKDEAFSHGYRVIFRTETDTYLLGNYPYKFCKWDDITLVCQEIENLLETECQMVGVLSQNDLELLSEAGIYIPGQFEMWTSTPVTEVSTKVYFRNSNGSFLASKDKSKESGVCALIRVSTVQNDEALLSTALPNYEAIKAQFEAEEEQYILETSNE